MGYFLGVLTVLKLKTCDCGSSLSKENYEMIWIKYEHVQDTLLEEFCLLGIEYQAGNICKLQPLLSTPLDGRERIALLLFEVQFLNWYLVIPFAAAPSSPSLSNVCTSGNTPNRGSLTFKNCAHRLCPNIGNQCLNFYIMFSCRSPVSAIDSNWTQRGDSSGLHITVMSNYGNNSHDS